MTGLHRWTDGVLPSWEGVLNLATRAKLHVALLIWWRWYFCWIPLSERCKIDLKIILFGWAELVFWIYFSTHVQFVKVGQNCNIGSQAPKVVSHTHSHGYKKERHDAHFIIHSSHTSLSHLIGSYNLRGFSLLHMCETRSCNFQTGLGLFWKTLTNVDFGSNIEIWLRF